MLKPAKFIPKITTKTWIIIGSLFALSLLLPVGFTVASRRPVNCSLKATAPNAVVALRRDHAEPSVLSIPVGSYVQFNSCDSRPHNIGQGSGDDVYHQAAHEDQHDHTKGGLESGVFAANEGYRLQFKQAGVYNFHDHLNPKITITVVAYDPNVK